MEITTIGLDLAKSVFQVHAVAELGSIWQKLRDHPLEAQPPQA